MSEGPYQRTKRRAEDAFKLLIEQRGGEPVSGITIYRGFGAVGLNGKRIEVVSEKATPEIGPSGPTGNMTLTLTVTVISDLADLAADGRSAHDERCGAIEDLLLTQDVCEQINAMDGLTDFHAFLWTPGESEDTVGEDEVYSEYKGELYCCADTAVEG